MRITKDMVGKKVRRVFWDEGSYLEIICVGNSQFFTKNQGDVEDCWSLSLDDWEFYEEPKKIVRKAPAIIRNPNYYREHIISHELFESKDDAEFWYKETLVKWPANDNMWVEVEVKE